VPLPKHHHKHHHHHKHGKHGKHGKHHHKHHKGKHHRKHLKKKLKAKIAAARKAAASGNGPAALKLKKLKAKLKKLKKKAHKHKKHHKKGKKKHSKKHIRAAKLRAAAAKAAALNVKLLPAKGFTYKNQFTSITVPDPANPGKTQKVSVQVQVPSFPATFPGEVTVKTESKVLKAASGKSAQTVTVKRAYKAIRQAVVDPVNPGMVATVDVAVEVPLPPKKVSEAVDHANDVLSKHVDRLEKKIVRMKEKISQAKRKVAASPVLEDGAPAPPDRQQIEMAQDLYKVLEATVMHKAGEIREHYLNAARDQVVVAAANHQANADFSDKNNESYLLPQK